MAILGERESTFKSLNEAYRGALRVSNYRLETDRYVILSDLHKGDKDKGSDDFLRNERIYCYALQYYLDQDYRLILNGDVEEGWESSYSPIIEAYESTAFAMERCFASQGEARYMRTFGNHDLEWADPEQVNKYLVPVLGPVRVHPAVLLGDRIFVVHGHQGDPFSDQRPGLSRFVVRHVWRRLQKSLGLMATRAATNNLIRRNRDKFMYEWAKDQHVLLIAGHTHRAMFESFSKTYQLTLVRDRLLELLESTADPYMRHLLPAAIDYITRVIESSKEEMAEDKERSRLDPDPVPCYFNDGSCVHPNGMTGIELDQGEIRLVKWEVSDTFCSQSGGVKRPNLFAHIERRIYQTGDLGEILSNIAK